jgi:hypothetical protein
LTFNRLHQGSEVVFLTDRHKWFGSERRVFGVVGRASWPAPEEQVMDAFHWTIAENEGMGWRLTGERTISVSLADPPMALLVWHDMLTGYLPEGWSPGNGHPPHPLVGWRGLPAHLYARPATR